MQNTTNKVTVVFAASGDIAGAVARSLSGKTSPTLKQVGETAAFLASGAGVVFNSHIADVDCGKMNIL